MVGLLPLVNASQVPLSRLERRLDYRTVGTIELASVVYLYLVGIALVELSHSHWAMVVAFMAQQAFLAVAFFVADRFTPRVVRPTRDLWEAVRFGSATSAATLSLASKALIPTLIVGPIAGLLRLATQLSASDYLIR